MEEEFILSVVDEVEVDEVDGSEVVDVEDDVTILTVKGSTLGGFVVGIGGNTGGMEEDPVGRGGNVVVPVVPVAVVELVDDVELLLELLDDVLVVELLVSVVVGISVVVNSSSIC